MLIFSFIFVFLLIVIAVVAFCIGKRPLLLNVVIALGMLAWIIGGQMHSYNQQSIEKKCKIAYELDAKGKRELAAKIVNHNNISYCFFFGLFKIDPEKYPDLVPDTVTVSNESKEDLVPDTVTVSNETKEEEMMKEMFAALKWLVFGSVIATVLLLNKRGGDNDIFV